MLKLSKGIFIVTLALTSNLVFADSALLTDFLAKAKTLRANFTQTVDSGKKARTTSGSMEIMRPNKFRWQYQEEDQLIISDGQRIYIYDKPLMQVTIKQLGKSLDRSPAALLAGANDINKLYQVTQLSGTNQGLTWVKIEPKAVDDNNGFQVVMMGFDSKEQLAAMKFTDSFGNQTSLQFKNLQTGVTISDKDFTFKIPAGVDVAEQ